MPESILRLPEVIKRTGLSKSTIYLLLKTDNRNFPRPIKILGSRAIGFVESEIDSWITEQIELHRSITDF